MKEYILENWKRYDVVDTRERMIALLNILEAHGETLDSFLRASCSFCGIEGIFSDDRDKTQTLFDHNCYYKNMEELNKICAEDAECAGMTLEEFLEDEDIRKTSDGLVRVLYF